MTYGMTVTFRLMGPRDKVVYMGPRKVKNAPSVVKRAAEEEARMKGGSSRARNAARNAAVVSPTPPRKFSWE